MAKTVVIDPITRIEGHAKISVILDDAGDVSDARFHVVEYRGFEKFCEGRPFTEMAGITARICGICPVSHLICSVKTGDKLLAVQIPQAADKLRRLLNLAQIIQSHALSFFHLSSPDFILGWDSDPARRNLFGLIAADPDFARAGIRLRQFGQKVIELLGGRKIHAAWTVPGGVRSPLSEAGRAWIQARLPESLDTIRQALALFKRLIHGPLQEEVQVFGEFPSLFMSLVGPEGAWEHYDGQLRFTDSNGHLVADQLSEADYSRYVGEAVEDWSYLKFPYYKALGYPAGIYRVGPLARLNTCTHIGTPEADAELQTFQDFAGGVATSSFLYHYARLIEILACLEKIQAYMDDPDLMSSRCRASAGVNQLEAIGVSEAPRGTLFHHYKVDENGLIEKVNLIIATGQNNLAMNKAIKQIAQHYIHGEDIREGFLNRVEAGIRCFDPCLSCSTHAAGQMPLKIQLVNSTGEVVREVVRD